MTKKAKSSKKKHKTSSSGSASSFSLSNIKIILILSGIALASISYRLVFSSNVKIKSDQYYIYLPAKANATDLADILSENEIINNGISFRLMASILELTPRSKSGLYKIEKNWNNYQLIKAINEQDPVPSVLFEIPKVRARNNMLSQVSNALKLNKEKLKSVLNDTLFTDSLGILHKESIYCIFIPGVYNIPVGSNEKDLVRILHGEFLHFFNEERMDKAENLDLQPEEVVTLASIVYSETKNYPEMPSIAGVYINRLKGNMKLEADPTLVFASGNLNTRRVYKNKKLIYPEYNTYNRKGLPPGPIHFPPVEVIDAVLNYDDHEYFYFCARDDSSGTHSFASTFEEHKANADKFRKYLNAKKIY